VHLQLIVIFHVLQLVEIKVVDNFAVLVGALSRLTIDYNQRVSFFLTAFIHGLKTKSSNFKLLNLWYQGIFKTAPTLKSLVAHLAVVVFLVDPGVVVVPGLVVVGAAVVVGPVVVVPVFWVVSAAEVVDPETSA